MLRDAVKQHYIGMNQEFRHRGEDQTRVEAFSDAVFALAVTLLLISSTPPVTFYQLKLFVKDLFPFALCITLLTLIWYEHFKFFIRYGFRNSKVIFLNTLLLFIVLFYVYPLKFLCKLLVIIFTNLFWIMTGNRGYAEWDDYLFMMDGGSQPELMIIYGIGGASVFLVLALMYRYAYMQRDALQLNEIEIFDTRTSIFTNLLMAGVPLVSVFFAVVLGDTNSGRFFSGFSYFLYPVIMFPYGRIVNKSRKKLLENAK